MFAFASSHTVGPTLHSTEDKDFHHPSSKTQGAIFVVPCCLNAGILFTFCMQHLLTKSPNIGATHFLHTYIYMHGYRQHTSIQH